MVEYRRGDRVKYVGINGDADGPVGRVVGLAVDGLRVRWDSGRREIVHPEDVRPVQRQEKV